MDPSSQSIIAMGAALPAVDIAVVALRFVSKRQKRNPYRIDDWLILISLFLACGCGAALIAGSIKAGLGNHAVGDHSLNKDGSYSPSYMEAKKWYGAFEVMLFWQLGTAKLSVLFFYKNIFSISQTFKVVSWTMIVIVIVWVLEAFLTSFFQCGSHSILTSNFFTSHELFVKHCIPGTPLALGEVIPDVVLDIVILCMPIYRTSKMHMSKRKRIAVCGVFFFGVVASVASIIRLILYIPVYYNTGEKLNILAKLSTTMYWSMFEVGSSIIAACLPTLWPLVTHERVSKLASSLRSILLSWHQHYRTNPDSISNVPQPRHPSLPKVEEVDEDESESDEGEDEEAVDTSISRENKGDPFQSV